ncbi:uncharacterized protein TRAVEDRAFT_99853, partial [Trametes versicolor FP-101664 SS1]|uniref:uncharacterized protein n=1 Tax=Trametes versicolor (strain FP-101664) TaxID=717944 RepID=UPI000462458B
RMDRFPCDGWLHLTVSSTSDEISVSMKHAEDHVAYTELALPEKWKAYIRENARRQTPGQIWGYLLAEEDAEEDDLPYGPNAVYYYWHIVSREEWRLADDPLASARKFVEERGEKHHIVLLDVEAAPGTQTLAFYVTDFVEMWAKHTQELAMDSTWNTNGGNFELFAAVADANGAGVPLAFLFIQTTKDAAPGAKQAILERFLGHLKALGVDPEFTLTDKDWSEINAMAATWPDAKQQLCFWHGVRAVKQRLCKNKDTPAFYDSVAANREFPFIDIDFVPAAQRIRDLTRSLTRMTAAARSMQSNFCPAPHRLPIIRIHSKHGCQHPLLPERHGESRSSEDIYRDAVHEMYLHCKANNLAEVWAYLWNLWYRRPHWKLWARSANSRSIPRKRTTMIVEALWRNLKRLVLYMYNCPPIDLALYAVVTKALP